MASSLQGIKSIEQFHLDDVRVFLRLDLNVPLDANGKISDDTRLRAALPTISYALEKGAKLVLASHLGRPSKAKDPKKLSMEVVAQALQEMLEVDVFLVEDPASDTPKALLAGLKAKQVILLENLRFNPGEESNSREFAQHLADYTDLYINDAFGASHRQHASIYALPTLVEKKGIGLLMKKEIEMLERVRNHPDKPFVAVMGGSKVSDKITVIEKLMDAVDVLIIGGAMAYTFLLAKGEKVGTSRVEKDRIQFAKDVIRRFESRGKKLLLPVDHLASSSFEHLEDLAVTSSANIPEGKMGLDIGPKTIELFDEAIKTAKTVFWNGPMGVFERKELSQGTFAMAQAIAESDSLSIVGGGDSAAAAEASGFADQFTHISTGGGASLEFLEGVKLPGLEVLRPPKRSEESVEEL
ncbi:MAG: phosphoglycerate kinase [Bdellovibrionaceae bacterium]|nr:phosphoglycerate kinase [Pseudobdellovibrionaceae bacterium]|tara:strand:+ start:1850 stop:3085 length:1236 start_codon:yes stop_codon:yes gene_type:complete